MKTKLFAALLCAMCITLVGCKNEPKNKLCGTVWGGRVAYTDVEATFSTNTDCSIDLRGYATGSGIGTYIIKDSKAIVTIQSTTGDFDGQAKKGDVFECPFSLENNTMEVTLYNGKVTATLIRRQQ